MAVDIFLSPKNPSGNAACLITAKDMIFYYPTKLRKINCLQTWVIECGVFRYH